MLPAQSTEMMREIEHLQHIVDDNPKDDASALRLANTLHDAAMTNPNLLQRAIDIYTKYLRLKPDNPDARVDLGICYFEKGRTDSNNAMTYFSQAIAEMQAAFTKHSTHQPAAFNLGIVNLHAGNFQESTRWFTKAVEINPNSELGKRAKEMVEQHSFQGQIN
jgi:tetratricopeptide (TPR) repeat protein